MRFFAICRMIHDAAATTPFVFLFSRLGLVAEEDRLGLKVLQPVLRALPHNPTCSASEPALDQGLLTPGAAAY